MGNTGNTGRLGGLLNHKSPSKFSYFALPEILLKFLGCVLPRPSGGAMVDQQEQFLNSRMAITVTF